MSRHPAPPAVPGYTWTGFDSTPLSATEPRRLRTYDRRENRAGVWYKNSAEIPAPTVLAAKKIRKTEDSLKRPAAKSFPGLSRKRPKQILELRVSCRFRSQAPCKERASVISDSPLPLQGKGRTVINRSSPRVQNRKGRSGLPGIIANVHDQEAPTASCCSTAPQQPAGAPLFGQRMRNSWTRAELLLPASKGDPPEAICSAVLFPYAVGKWIQALVLWHKDSAFPTCTVTLKARHWRYLFTSQERRRSSFSFIT